MSETNQDVLLRLLALHESGRGSPRLLRLFTCARLRASRHIQRARLPFLAVQLGERLSDGLADQAEVRRFVGLFTDAWLPLLPDPLKAAIYVLEEHPWVEQRGGHVLLDEIFGPQTPVFDSGWRPPDVLSVARATYQDRAPLPGQLQRAGLLVLADALSDAGCDDPAILGHLRANVRHVPGCWCLDLISDARKEARPIENRGEYVCR